MFVVKHDTSSARHFFVILTKLTIILMFVTYRLVSPPKQLFEEIRVCHVGAEWCSHPSKEIKLFALCEFALIIFFSKALAQMLYAITWKKSRMQGEVSNLLFLPVTRFFVLWLRDASFLT